MTSWTKKDKCVKVFQADTKTKKLNLYCTLLYRLKIPHAIGSGRMLLANDPFDHLLAIWFRHQDRYAATSPSTRMSELNNLIYVLCIQKRLQFGVIDHRRQGKQMSQKVVVKAFKKHNDMIVMKPTSKKITLLSRRLYYLLLAFAQNNMNGVEPTSSKLFEAPLLDLLKSTKSAESGFTLAKKYFREMMDCKVEWETTNENNKKKWSGMPLLSEAHIYSKEGRDYIAWAFPPSIIGMILKPEVYSILNLAILKEIDSYVGLALYDICSRYRDNPTGVTSRNSIRWWVESLSQSPIECEEDVNWRVFKAKKLNAAIDEINNCTDIFIELLEFKVGKKISEVQFCVKQKVDIDPIDYRTQRDNNNAAYLSECVISYDISVEALESLISRYGETLVIEKLKQLQDRINNKSLQPIDDFHNYLKKTLSSQYSATNHTSQILSNSVNTTVCELLPSDHKTKQQQIRDEFNSLNTEDRIKWIKQVAESLKERKIFSNNDQKKSEKTTISAGTFGAEVIAMYAKSTRGDAWLTS